METKEFLRPRLVGRRFEKHGLPLDILRDFSVLDEMIRNIAISIYKEEHSKRLRIPRNFMDPISLQITGLEEGSTILKIMLVTSSLGLSPLLDCGAEYYAEQAKDRLIATIQAYGSNTPIGDKKLMTPSQLAMFNRFGCSLLEDEKIEFYINERDSNLAVLNKDIRKRLVEASSIKENYRESVYVYGIISELDLERRSFMINSLTNSRIPVAQYNAELEEDIIAAHGQYRKDQKVLIKGIGVKKNEKIVSIENVESIDLLEQCDIGYRIEELKQFKDGWYEDNKGSSFSEDALKKLKDLFDSFYPSDQEQPYLYPALDNIVQAEWDIGHWKVSVEIKLDDFSSSFLAVDINSDQAIEKDLMLSSEPGWNEMLKTLKELKEQC